MFSSSGKYSISRPTNLSLNCISLRTSGNVLRILFERTSRKLPSIPSYSARTLVGFSRNTPIRYIISPIPNWAPIPARPLVIPSTSTGRIDEAKLPPRSTVSIYLLSSIASSTKLIASLGCSNISSIKRTTSLSALNSAFVLRTLPTPCIWFSTCCIARIALLVASES